MFKSLSFFIFLAVILLLVQIGSAYLSVLAFLEGDLVQASLYFIFVPLIGAILIFYYTWIRKNRGLKED